MENLRIIFMGTPDFAVPTLVALAESKHDVVAVLTNPDRVAGRGKKIQPPPVKVAAQSYSIPVIQPEKVKNNKDLQAQFRQLEPDVAVVVAYGQILPTSVLELPKYGCLNVHASLLPKYRGASPINAAIIHGEEESGVSIMKMERGLDTGPVLGVAKTPITSTTNAQDLHDTLATLGAGMIVQTVEDWCQGKIEATPQDDSASSYAPMMSKEDGLIDWNLTSEKVDQHIRGVFPWPGAFTHFDHDNKVIRTKILRASVYEISNEFNQLSLDPGCIFTPDNDTILVACDGSLLKILELQPAGKKAMSPRDFINGFQPQPNDRFY